MDRLLVAMSIIESNIDRGYQGLYFTENLLGDTTKTIFKKDYLKVNLCVQYKYFEVFGLSLGDELTLHVFYKKLLDERSKDYEVL